MNEVTECMNEVTPVSRALSVSQLCSQSTRLPPWVPVMLQGREGPMTTAMSQMKKPRHRAVTLPKDTALAHSLRAHGRSHIHQLLEASLMPALCQCVALPGSCGSSVTCDDLGFKA